MSYRESTLTWQMAQDSKLISISSAFPWPDREAHARAQFEQAYTEYVARHLQAFARKVKRMLVWSVQLAARMLLEPSCAEYAETWHLDAGLASSAHGHKLLFVLQFAKVRSESPYADVFRHEGSSASYNVSQECTVLDEA